MPDEITLSLSPQRVQQILNVLVERPYREVHEIVSEIVRQGNQQLAKGDMSGEGGGAPAGLRPIRPSGGSQA